MESKEELKNKIYELRNENGILKMNIKKINIDIVNLKRKPSKTDSDYKQLKLLRKQLSEYITQLAKNKYNLNKLDKNYNLFYNEHNINNITDSGISSMFLSYSKPQTVMKEMGFEQDKNKTYGENCRDFLEKIVSEDRMRELYNIMRLGIENEQK